MTRGLSPTTDQPTAPEEAVKIQSQKTPAYHDFPPVDETEWKLQRTEDDNEEPKGIMTDRTVCVVGNLSSEVGDRSPRLRRSGTSCVLMEWNLTLWRNLKMCRHVITRPPPLFGVLLFLACLSACLVACLADPFEAPSSRLMLIQQILENNVQFIFRKVKN